MTYMTENTLEQSKSSPFCSA